jgi:hypothetical protein
LSKAQGRDHEQENCSLDLHFWHSILNDFDHNYAVSHAIRAQCGSALSISGKGVTTIIALTALKSRCYNLLVLRNGSRTHRNMALSTI